jgi:hypothetical protein
MYGWKNKILVIYLMTILNSIAGVGFLYLFLRVFMNIEFQAYHEDYGDYEVSKTTVMVHNIPAHIPVIEANTLLGQIFKSRFNRELEAVHTVGRYDKRKLDHFYNKRNRYQDNLEMFKDTGTYRVHSDKTIRWDYITIYKKDWCSKIMRLMTWWFWMCKMSIGTKRISVPDYYFDKIRYIDSEISRLKIEGVSQNQGIAFVTFTSEYWVYETFTDFDLIKDIAKNSEASKLLRINGWRMSKAPPPSDIKWENLSDLTRCKRKSLRLMYLFIILLISSTLIVILALLDKLAPIMHSIFREDYPKIVFTIVTLQYMTPLILLLYNYIIVPVLIRIFIEKWLYIRKSHQEESNLSWNYIFLIANTIFIPMLMFTACYSYKLMPTGCFFIRYIIQVLFVYCIANLLGVPKQ